MTAHVRLVNGLVSELVSAPGFGAAIDHQKGIAMDNGATQTTHRCPVCDSPIKQSRRGRPRIYCSDSCKQAAYEARHDIAPWTERERATDDIVAPSQRYASPDLSFELEHELARKAERDRRTTYTSKEVLREFCRANPLHCVEVVIADPMLCSAVLRNLSALIRDLRYPTEDSGWAVCYQAILELRSSVDFITGAIAVGATPTKPTYNNGDPRQGRREFARGCVMSRVDDRAVRSIDAGVDPRHVFLDARDVMARYGWGKTKGYQNLKDRDLVPQPVMTHPDRWRLDQLMDWEEWRIESAVTIAPAARPVLADRFPPSKRSRRVSTS